MGPVIAILSAATCVATPAPDALPHGGAARPTLSGTEESYLTADGGFRLHYTRQGDDAVSARDLDGDGVPDAVQWAEDGLRTVWAAFVDGDGWPAPGGDDGIGGDARLDVYLRVLDNNGYAHAQAASGGTSCWMELDPGVAAGLGERVFASVAGHELHHCLQFAVTTGLDAWIYEATSTYAQYLLFTDDEALGLGRDVLWQLRLARSEEALDVTEGQLEYAAMVWVKYLLDRGGGDRAALLGLWQAMATAGDWEAGHAAALPALFGVPTLLDGAAELAEWQWFACDRDDGRHWRDDPARCVLAADVRPARATPLPAQGTAAVEGRLGSAYVHVPRDCATADVRLEITPTAAMRIQVLGGAELAAVELAADEPAVVLVEDWNHAADVVIIGTAATGAATFAWSASATGGYQPGAEPGPCEPPAPPPPDDDELAGCGCAGGGPGAPAGAALAVVVALALTRRRA